MRGTTNTSQDPEYEGPTYHEKKFHKTHFQATFSLRKRKRPVDMKTALKSLARRAREQMALLEEE